MEKRKSKLVWPKNARLYAEKLKQELMEKDFDVESNAQTLGRLSEFPYFKFVVRRGKGFFGKLFGRKVLEIEQTRGEKGEIRVYDSDIEGVVIEFVKDKNPRSCGLSLDLKIAA